MVTIHVLVNVHGLENSGLRPEVSLRTNTAVHATVRVLSLRITKQPALIPDDVVLSLPCREGRLRVKLPVPARGPEAPELGEQR
jgi:hypothetical protein